MSKVTHLAPLRYRTLLMMSLMRSRYAYAVYANHKTSAIGVFLFGEEHAHNIGVCDFF